MINTKQIPELPTLKANPKNLLKDWEKTNNDAQVLARWMSLYDAVNLIFDTAEKKNIDIDNVELPPIKIKEYMDSVVDIYHRKLLKNFYNIDIVFSDTDKDKNSF